MPFNPPIPPVHVIARLASAGGNHGNTRFNAGIPGGQVQSYAAATKIGVKTQRGFAKSNSIGRTKR